MPCGSHTLHHVVAFPQESRNIEIFRLIARRGGPHPIKRNHLGMRRITRLPKRYRRGIWLEGRFRHENRLGLGHRFGLVEAIALARSLSRYIARYVARKNDRIV